MTYRFKRRRGAAGRPALPESEKRSVRHETLTTEKEAVRLRQSAEAAGLSVSEYLRSRALDTDSDVAETE